MYDVGDTSDVGQSNDLTQQPPPPPPYAEATLCPYIQTSITKSDGTISCKYGERCPYQHGELCDICGSYCLHPTDENQRKTHQKVCAVHEFVWKQCDQRSESIWASNVFARNSFVCTVRFKSATHKNLMLIPLIGVPHICFTTLNEFNTRLIIMKK